MKCSEVIQKLSELAPEQLACDWDNPGLLIGRREKSVSKILIVLDITEHVIEYAIKNDVGMIVSHHPLIFRGMKKINDDDVFGRRIMKLIRSDITCYAMHTNYDVAVHGMGDMAAKRLQLVSCEVLADPVDYISAAGQVYHGGVGRVGMLPEPMTMKAFCQLVKEQFDIPRVQVFSRCETDRISRVAICPGSGKDYISRAAALGADVYLSGDIGHHGGIDAWEQGLPVVDAGHYGLEHIFVEAIEDYLQDCVNADVELLTMTGTEPFYYL